MGHDAGEFGLFGGAQDQAAVHIEKPARKSESVHFVRVNHLDGEWDAGIGIANQVLPNAVDVLDYNWIIDQL